MKALHERENDTHPSTDRGSRCADDQEDDQRVGEDYPREDRESCIEIYEDDDVENVECTLQVESVGEKIQRDLMFKRTQNF